MCGWATASGRVGDDGFGLKIKAQKNPWTRLILLFSAAPTDPWSAHAIVTRWKQKPAEGRNINRFQCKYKYRYKPSKTAHFNFSIIKMFYSRDENFEY